MKKGRQMEPVRHKLEQGANRTGERSHRRMHKMLHIDSRGHRKKSCCSTPERKPDQQCRNEHEEPTPAAAPKSAWQLALNAYSKPDVEWDEQQGNQIGTNCKAEYDQCSTLRP